ncbi:MAG TPA: hypothetical protein PKD64_03995 [Pirellulaceae bacterium]|nr:hypothetical protein [Pirellulaceae bacterium]HMO91333.1 hypothetical protein [Pirellulaceae bacterium]HMP70151.1 hypothetical protein [Pirellulaceae bacterium]
MKHFVIIAFSLITLSGLALVSSVPVSNARVIQDQDRPLDRAEFMRRKTEDSQRIVKALVLEDYDEVRRYAQDLLLLSNESIWNAVQTSEYIDLSREFRKSASRLRDVAETHNVDSVTLAYFEVTMNCVRCHKYLREVAN